MRSPTSRVGHIDVEGIDLGSAKVDRNNKLTVAAVNIALASSEQALYNRDNQFQVFSKSFPLIRKVTVLVVLFPSSFTLRTTVPSLSTWQLFGSLHGSHFNPCRNGSMEAAFNGEIPQTPTAGEQEAPAIDFISEINPTAIVLLPKISPTIVLYIEA
uniref:Uncharacterized protein n=1 Tax=Rhizophora mucronata TaxID=61149 RepID=A0A2P2J9E3_RHIMU